MSDFVCGQDKCPRDFQSFNALRRRHKLIEHGSRSVSSAEATMNLDFSGGADPIDLDTELVELRDEDDDNDVYNNINVDMLFDDNGICLPAASFVAKLKSHSSIPASVVNDIVNDVQNFSSPGCIGMLYQKIAHVLRSCNINMDSDEIRGLMHVFERLGDLFAGLKLTDYQQMKNFQNSGHYIAPETIVVGHRMDAKIQDGLTTQVPTNATAQHVPLRDVFKSIFQLSGVLQKAKDYLHDIQGNV